MTLEETLAGWTGPSSDTEQTSKGELREWFARQ